MLEWVGAHTANNRLYGLLAARESLCEKGDRWLAGSGEEGSTMQLSKGTRTMGRVGALVASASSMLVFAGPASAAGDTAVSYEHNHAQFSIQLTGDEVHDGGDRDGDGVARLDLDPENERVCYVITWRGLEGDVTDFHIHSGPRRSDGPVVVDLFNDRHFDGERGTVANCVHSDRSKIRDIIDEPSDYYLMLHTTPHHAGALRGQLD
jgi:hypothetical protein